MNINEQFLSSFEKRLVAIINSKEETQKRMQEIMQQPIAIRKDINIGGIDSYELADEIHNEICRLIKQKAYPVQEVEWFRCAGTNIWHFGFIIN